MYISPPRAGLAAAVMAAVTLISGFAAAQEATIRIATVNAPTSQSWKGVMAVAERVTERTDGRVAFQGFPSGQLGSTTDSIEQASQGLPMMTFTSASFLAGFGVPELAVVEGPFVVADNVEAERLANSSLMQGFYDRLAETAGLRVVALNWFDGPRHMIGTAAYPAPEDLRGVRMRVPSVETWMKTFQPLGVIPTSVEAAEVYSALSQGVVTAAESPLTGLRASGWYEVAKEITLTGHFNLFTGWVMSESVFQSLNEGDRAILLEEFRTGGQELAKTSAELEAEIRAEFEAKGVTFHEADVEAYRAATQGFYSSFPDWPEGLDDQVRAAAIGE
ncbi:C4-dicarboxylate ABC transporter substrate-binding protein (plasmid) [Paracoccus sp. Arc7-R13]|uniref:TRAP transporter substrate-binding protein DctP n=1 Tax=Paracoccus sp. Arc7-R13 TaxID=2500532 RepID=UPI000FD8693B|nr:TRAP transporter substrate-binding protein DctP [Paracoccus sp. Arc7-R13]AZY96034.1 C4-dicarboxylate ABC transporter substrate-binding protein [Paracoccus sp. Arc7-R13]